MQSETFHMLLRVNDLLQNTSFASNDGLFVESKSDFVEVVTERRIPNSNDVRLRIHIGRCWHAGDTLPSNGEIKEGEAGLSLESEVAFVSARAAEWMDKSLGKSLPSMYAGVQFQVEIQNDSGVKTLTSQVTNAHGSTFIDGVCLGDLCRLKALCDPSLKNSLLGPNLNRINPVNQLRSSSFVETIAAATNKRTSMRSAKLRQSGFDIVLESETEGKTSISVQSHDSEMRGKVIELRYRGITNQILLTGNRTSQSCGGRVTVNAPFDEVQASLTIHVVGGETNE